MLCAVSPLLILGRKLRPLVFFPILAALVLLPTALVQFGLELTVNFPWVIATVTFVTFLMLSVRFDATAFALLKPISRLTKPAVCGVAMLLAGIGVVGYACSEAEPQNSDELEDIAKLVEEEGKRDYQPAEGLSATTDLGSDVPLLRLTNSKADVLARSDERIIRNFNHAHLIRISGPSAQTNCHGWVFTGGLCWISTDGVELVLTENGYQQVETPVQGDLVVYRDDSGKVIHTGIVRAYSSDGRILIESKWGTLGAFVHFVDQSIYHGYWTFHRADRKSHLLRGLPETQGLTSRPNAKGS